MKAHEMEFLLINITQVLNLTRMVNMNKEAVATHTSTLKEARLKLDKYTELYKTPEYMATLSPPEKKCLQDNAQAVYGVHQELTKELEYLDMSKQPYFVINALHEMDHAYLLLEWLVEEVGKSGKIMLPHLQCLRPDKFGEGKYRNQIDSLYAELEAISHDFYSDHVTGGDVEESYPMLVPIADHLITAACWLRKERERLTTEAIPETKKIVIPEETTPELPKDKTN